MPHAHPVTSRAMVVIRLQLLAKIVPLTMSPQGQGRLALFALRVPSLPKETPPAVLAMPPVQHVIKPQRLALPVISTMSPQVQGQPVVFAVRGLTLRWEIPAVPPVTLLVSTATKLAPLAKTATSTTSPQGQGRPAPSVLPAPFPPRGTPPARHAMPPAKPASKRQPLASPAI